MYVKPIMLRGIVCSPSIDGSRMAWNCDVIPKWVEKIINKFRFDGTPNYKAIKCYIIERRDFFLSIEGLEPHYTRYVCRTHAVYCPTWHGNGCECARMSRTSGEDNTKVLLYGVNEIRFQTKTS